MDSPLTVIDPAAPRCRNPIAIGANRDELGYGWGADHNYWTRSGIANVFVALGEGGRGYRHASHPRNRNNGEQRITHGIISPGRNSKLLPKLYHMISRILLVMSAPGTPPAIHLERLDPSEPVRVGPFLTHSRSWAPDSAVTHNAGFLW
jgi:hypothetical protein